MIKLKKEEFKLIGNIEKIDNIFIFDNITKRINQLTEKHLKKIACDASGWNVLYQDPADNRYWELTYPNSEMHGGGPPNLINLSQEEVKSKFKNI